jgi:hypothetical protein
MIPSLGYKILVITNFVLLKIILNDKNEFYQWTMFDL